MIDLLKFMGYPASTQRNKELVKKRKQGWSYRKLANHYGINVKTAYEICQRVLGVIHR